MHCHQHINAVDLSARAMACPDVGRVHGIGGAVAEAAPEGIPPPTVAAIVVGTSPYAMKLCPPSSPHPASATAAAAAAAAAALRCNRSGMSPSTLVHVRRA